jgi:hypothetical protein
MKVQEYQEHAQRLYQSQIERERKDRSDATNEYWEKVKNIPDAFSHLVQPREVNFRKSFDPKNNLVPGTYTSGEYGNETFRPETGEFEENRKKKSFQQGIGIYCRNEKNVGRFERT